MTATEKWEDPWFRRLTPTMKLFWIFLLDKCNMAGIWEPDFDLVKFYLGPTVKRKDVEDSLQDKIFLLPDGKWFIAKFIPFQYKTLSSANRMHTPVIDILRRYDLLTDSMEIKGLASPLQGVKDKEQEQDKVQVQDQEQDKRVLGIPEWGEVQELWKVKNYPAVEAKKFFSYYSANGWRVGKNPMKNWKAAAAGWVMRSPDFTGGRNSAPREIPKTPAKKNPCEWGCGAMLTDQQIVSHPDTCPKFKKPSAQTLGEATQAINNLVTSMRSPVK